MLARLVAGAVLAIASVALHAASMSEVIGQPVTTLAGARAGAVDELIVDVESGRLLYVVIASNGGFQTLPARALDEKLRVDMRLAGEGAERLPRNDPRLRRAGRLLGLPLDQPGGRRIGTIRDIEFDPASGQLERVHVQAESDRFVLPASVLAEGQFPPMTLWSSSTPPESSSTGR